MFKKAKNEIIIVIAVIGIVVFNLIGCKVEKNVINEVTMNESNKVVLQTQLENFAILNVVVKEKDLNNNIIYGIGLDKEGLEYLGELCEIDCKLATITNKKNEQINLSDLKVGQVIQIEVEKVIQSYPSKTETKRIKTTDQMKELGEAGLREKEIKVYGKNELLEIQKLLGSYPNEISEKQGRLYGFTIITNKNISSGQLAYDYFIKCAKEKREIGIIILQYTVKGKPILKYISYKEGEFYFVEDVSRVLYKSDKEKYNTNTYKYINTLFGKEEKGGEVQLVILTNKKNITFIQVQQYEENETTNLNNKLHKVFTIRKK